MIDEGFSAFAEQEWPLTPAVGDKHTDPQGREWTCFAIAGGSKGGRWAYHVITADYTYKGVVADTNQHFHAVHFAGMLALPWDGSSKLGWVLGRKWCSPVAVKMEFAPRDATRFERLEEPPQED